jgi:hypothetical protein
MKNRWPMLRGDGRFAAMYAGTPPVADLRLNLSHSGQSCHTLKPFLVFVRQLIFRTN